MEQCGYNFKNENMDCFRVSLPSYIVETKATYPGMKWNEIPIFHDQPCIKSHPRSELFPGESVHFHQVWGGVESHGSMTISDPFILDPQVIRTSWLVAASAIPDWETWTSWNGWLEQQGFMKRGNKCNSELVFL